MNPAKIAEQFEVSGQLASIRPTGSGNVNDTYLAVFRTHFSEERIIVQRVNSHVFAQPEWIMENMSILTNHCHKQLQSESATADRIWQLPRIVPCRDGQDFFRDGQGDFWRALTLIASAKSYDVAQSAEHAFEIGTVLGQFHRLVSGMNPLSLRDTLPGFHETPKYLELYDAVIQTPAAKELAESSMEVRNLQRFVEERREFASVLQDALDHGELELRLIHGDPKISNVMIDDDTGKGTAIIDLDTAKPGLIHYDFGDALRSLCNRSGEETGELGKVVFDLDLCEAFVRGYIAYARDFLTDNDKKYLYDSIRLITFELGLRFFQDYLADNRYFKVKTPEQNLQRAKVQFRLCESIETRRRQIKEVLEQAFGDC
ncbi:N-acetylhexosamine 1-kinase [Pontiella desulfatans]|uniref:N-acetylhexosamine 1-kinase n=1 Tax=Pontiella desulfatans TaxID=2750659 RepID=A0A6C2U8L7_PONDE|nr:aminoglycoside phosphotransferase family protein [Pontiella desulfatans]VGO15754.1 N-acetylhexosamine 1-kinase [Pontiella desulfatans]